MDSEEIQERYDQRALADRTAQAIAHSHFTEQDIAFIGRSRLFATSGDAGAITQGVRYWPKSDVSEFRYSQSALSALPREPSSSA